MDVYLLQPERLMQQVRKRMRSAGLSRLAQYAARLAEHLGARTHTFDGGHVLQLGRGDAFRELARMLRAEGILAPRAE